MNNEKEGNRALFAFVAGAAVSLTLAALFISGAVDVVNDACSDAIKDTHPECSGSTSAGVFLGVGTTIVAIVGASGIGAFIYKKIK